MKKDVSLQTAPGENHFHSKNTGGVHIYVLPDGHVQQQELTGAGKIWAYNGGPNMDRLEHVILPYNDKAL